MSQSKEELRRALVPPSDEPLRPPIFDGAGKAAERLRRLPAWRLARVVAVMPDPVLLQVRVNVLGDGKTLIAATPGLKDGLVRVTPDMAPISTRTRQLTGHALAVNGKVLRFPGADLSKVDLLVGAVLAVDDLGHTLGDGRGMLDLTYALIGLVTRGQQPPQVAVLTDDGQLTSGLPRDKWDVAAQVVVTPTKIQQPGPVPRQPEPGVAGLPKKLITLPVVQGVLALGR